MGEALTVGDYAYARSARFRANVERAQAAIVDMAQRGPIGVSYSGGKDSTCALHLVRQIIPEAPAAFYDSGCEHPGTYEMVMHYQVETVHPHMSLQEMCRSGGYWGHVREAEEPVIYDFFDWLVAEPAERFIAEHGLIGLVLGLRAGESAGRQISAKVRGEIYQLSTGIWRCCPLARWSDDDVWAYIASRGLRYNPAYDRMAQAGLPRRAWRVGTLLGLSGANMGRLAWLRYTEPLLWAKLYAEFPMIARWT